MPESNISNSEKVVRILSIILAIVFLIVLVLVKVANPEFKLGMVFFIGFLIILFFVGIIVGYHYFQKKSPAVAESTGDQVIPPAITLEQTREIVHSLLRNPVYADYIPDCKGETNELLGESPQSLVYTYKAKGVYDKDMYYVIINRNYPNELFNILINPNLNELNRAKRLCAKKPGAEPNVKETTSENPLLGTKTVTREIIVDTSKEKEKAKKEDL